MNTTLSQMPTVFLGGLSPAAFLHRHWQKAPLLIRQAIPEFASPLSAEELAGLACEPEVESRLVLEHPGAEPPWSVRQGPFAEADFAGLPASHWTLLVQGVNKYLPAVADLLDGFDFVPGWRIDDVMISYAPAQGSVGPHVDQYDVFLLQGYGHRRWQIAGASVHEAELIPDVPLRILRTFEPDQEWVLEPGDMLYLPPGVPHHGVALDDCMTFSVGFRAPAAAELVGLFYDEVAAGLREHERYADPDLEVPAHPGQITPEALAQVQDIIRREYLSRDATERWFGRMITEPKLQEGLEPREDTLTEAQFRARVLAGGVLRRSEYGRFAYIDRGTAGALLYVDGQEIALGPDAAPAAPLICDTRRFPPSLLAPCLDNAACLAVLTELYQRNALYFEDEDE